VAFDGVETYSRNRPSEDTVTLGADERIDFEDFLDEARPIAAALLPK
jgi:hypothetical protein